MKPEPAPYVYDTLQSGDFIRYLVLEPRARP